jgi:hypothetical protein
MTQSEHKDLQVPLNVVAKASAGPAVSKEQALRQAAINASAQALRVISAVLAAEGTSGWEPEGPTDLPGLLPEGRVVWRQTGGIMFSWQFTFDSATLRFQRALSLGEPARMPAGNCDRCGSPLDAAARFCSLCGAAIGAAGGPTAGEGEARGGDARCNFCGKTRSEVRVLVSGRGAYICDECIRLNHEQPAQ